MSIYKSLPEPNAIFIAHPAHNVAPTHRYPTFRRLFFVLFAFFFTATLSYLITKHPTDSVATVSGFNPGNIINDYTMGNYGTMTEAEIQAFLTAKNPCSNNNAATYQYLIAHYNEELGKPTSTHSWHFADGHFVCLSEELFGEGTEIGVAGGETAAHIIWQAAQDYKINPQVLIVLLEKEQGLITDSIPRSGQYRSATGYGCPDTAACDTKYYGFKNQVRNAAALFRSALNGESSYYPVGNNFVLYNPNSSCGGSWVNIENLATGVLYRYTPYQPNAAALAAGSGTGDSCSAYGNRNFYHFFTTWFGSTQTSADVKSNIVLPEGEYVIQPISAPTYSLDVYGASDADGANVQLFSAHSGDAQKVNLIYNPNTQLYNIINIASKKAIATSSSGATANVQLANLNSSSCTQQWAIQLIGDEYRIISACSGAALDFHNISPSDEANLAVWPVNNDKTQSWQIVSQATPLITTGIYNVQSTNGLALDVNGAYKKSGTNVQLWTAHNESNRQKYQIISLADGTYHIIDLNSNLYLDVNGAIGTNGTNVQIWAKSDSCAQKWLIESDPQRQGTYHILSSCAPKKALDINGANLKNSVNIQIWDQNNSIAQDWSIRSTEVILEDGDYRIVYAADTSKSLNIADNSTASGAKIYLGQASTFFHIARGSDGYYTIKSLSSGHFVDAYGALAQNGTQIQQWAANSTCAQKWEIQQNTDKSYRIVSACSGLHSIDLYEGNPKLGNKIELWYNNDTVAQKWHFNKE